MYLTEAEMPIDSKEETPIKDGELTKNGEPTKDGEPEQ